METSPSFSFAPACAPARPLRVHVLVDLAWAPAAGGHVKVWERLAGAAIGMTDRLDLTVHFSGAAPATHLLGTNVRFRVHRPVFSTARLPFLAHVPDHTDRARHHRGLAAHLGDADVLHTTDAYFAFARTAERIARRRRVALVSSVHTDTPRYTALFTAQTVERALGRGGLGRALVRLCNERWSVPGRAEVSMRRRLLAHQRRCDCALVSRPEELERLARALSPDRVGLLRRGIDHALFSPARRDRAWLEETFGVPRDRLVVLFVGRLDRGKNVLTLVEAVRALASEGWPLHLLCAGAGPDRAIILDRLPGAASCPGVLAPATLARTYASADLLAHPSEIEECSNVVLEGLASGLPVLASAGAGRAIASDQIGVVVRGAGVGPWAAALRALCDDGPRRTALARAARRFAEESIPSWADVLAQDLLPLWTKAVLRQREGGEEGR